MNRMPSPLGTDEIDSPLSFDYALNGVLDAGHPPQITPHHEVFAPLHFEPNYAYPLLIWLHGGGDSERQLRQVMPNISLRNYVAYAPRGSRRTGSKAASYFWPQTNLGIVLAEQSIEECLAAAQARFKIDSRRLFLAGCGEGGTMAFRVGLANPNRFAGVLSLGGPFPRGGSPLKSVGGARKVPLFVAHGRDSQQYSMQRACDELRLFHSAGLTVTLRQYPGGDELSPQMLKDMDSWIMEQVNGTAESATSSQPKSRYFDASSAN